MASDQNLVNSITFSPLAAIAKSSISFRDSNPSLSASKREKISFKAASQAGVKASWSFKSGAGEGMVMRKQARSVLWLFWPKRIHQVVVGFWFSWQIG